MSKNLVALTGSVLTVCCLAACSSSGNGSTPTKGASASGTSAKGSSTATQVPSTITQPTGKLPSFENDPAVRKWNTIDSCTATAAGWQASGTIASKAAATHDYQVQVVFTLASTGTVQAFGSTRLTVAAGAAGKWQIQQNFKAATNTTCIAVGVTQVK